MKLRRTALLYTMAMSPLVGQTLSFLYPKTTELAGFSAATQICGKCVALADFNGDGKMDIVFAAMEFTPEDGVLLGNGDGSFRLMPLQGNEQEPAGVLAADFNGDGKPDIAFSWAYRTWLYLGKGDGTFTGPVIVSACNGLAAVADLNRDGKPDLICGAFVLLGNGDGTFHPGPGVLDGNPLLVADFNGDGSPDVLLTNVFGQLAVALSRGDGTFAPDMPISATLIPQSILTGDFNGDGRMDLLGESTIGSQIEVLPGNGDGTFGPVIKTPVGAPGPVTAAADFNGDGKLDLVAGDAVFAGNGDGSFQFPVFTGVATALCDAPYAINGISPCNYSHVITLVADFNGDGLPDIAAAHTFEGINSRGSAWVSILLNDAPGDGFTATGVSSANGFWPVTPGSLVSAYGVNLAPQVEAAGSSPYPTTLGGIRLHVSYRSQTNDILAPLLYVSPTQINYILPAADPYVLAPGEDLSYQNPYAWVSIEHVGSTYVPKGMSVPIAASAFRTAVRGVVQIAP
jgi:hypothetical protein